MTTVSLFWFVMFAGLGGVVVFVGLLMEKLAGKEKYKNISDFRRSKLVREMGEWMVIGGIVIEVAVAASFAALDWGNEPLNRPMETVSAYARILVKGDRYLRQSPKFKENSGCGLAFLIGTNVNETNILFSLSAGSSEICLNNILGSIHQNQPVSNMPNDRGLGQPARRFEEVNSLVMSIPQFEKFDPFHSPTNTQILGGSVTVTINSSLSWKFEIPPQIEKFGFISSTKIKNANGKAETIVLPFHIVDMTGHPVGSFDGK